MYLVALAWIYVALMMAAAEATSSNGTVLGAVFTFLLYGAMPLAIVLYVMGAPGRKRMRHAREAMEAAALAASSSAPPPGEGDHPPADPLSPERKEP
jgi:mannose/fructose/N-acetylgalactosamine-specific phosphotransferase system component IID